MTNKNTVYTKSLWIILTMLETIIRNIAKTCWYLFLTSIGSFYEIFASIDCAMICYSCTEMLEDEKCQHVSTCQENEVT